MVYEIYHTINSAATRDEKNNMQIELVAYRRQAAISMQVHVHAPWKHIIENSLYDFDVIEYTSLML